jgi:hypothetical protein
MDFSKLSSARFLMAIMFSLTACVAFLTGKLPAEGFMSLVGAAVTAYFMKGQSADTQDAVNDATKLNTTTITEPPKEEVKP